MNKQVCPEHAELIALVRSGSPGEDIQAHVDTCRACSGMVQVILELTPLADRSPALPHASEMYWRARARTQLDASRRSAWRAAGPLRYFHMGMGVVLIAASMVIVASPILFGEFGMVTPLTALAAAGGAYLVSQGREGTHQGV